MSSELEQVLGELGCLRASPWDLAGIPHLEMHELLDRLWMEEWAANEVDREGEFMQLVKDGTLPVDDDDIPDLRAKLTNVKTWYPRARENFRRRTRRFAEMRLASSPDYAKHFPLSGMTDEQVCAATTRNGAPSLLFCHVRTDTLEQLMFFVLVERWREVLGSDKLRAFVDVGSVIGASEGKATPYLAVDLNTSTPICHIYPVGPNELRQPVLNARRLGPLLREFRTKRT